MGVMDGIHSNESKKDENKYDQSELIKEQRINEETRHKKSKKSKKKDEKKRKKSKHKKSSHKMKEHKPKKSKKSTIETHSSDTKDSRIVSSSSSSNSSDEYSLDDYEIERRKVGIEGNSSNIQHSDESRISRKENNDDQIMEREEEIEDYGKTTIIREDWMLKPLARSSLNVDKSREVEEEERLRKKQQEEEEENKKRKLYIQPKSEEVQKRSYRYGDSGSNWRMMKLRKVYDIAKEENRTVEDVALERYGSLDAFQEALDERDFIERGKQNIKSNEQNRNITDEFGRSSRPFEKKGHHFYKPSSKIPSNVGEPKNEIPSTANSSSHAILPSKSSEYMDSVSASTQNHQDQNSNSSSSVTSKTRNIHVLPSEPILTTAQLNKLKAQVLKAKMMGKPEAEQLERDYNRQVNRSETQVISNVDIRGRIKDLGQVSSSTKEIPSHASKKLKFQSFDQQGERVQYYPGEQEQTLNDLVREEKMDQRHDYDQVMLSQISKDTTFEPSLDYMDESIDKMAKRSYITEEKKRKQAINEHKSTQNALEKCHYCYTPEKMPSVSVVALGTKVYLGLPDTIDMVPGHCLIIPIQHVLTTIECDDDVWDEIRNFMKCLIRMFDQQGKVVIFMEQATYFKRKRHTYIECIPIPAEYYDQVPAYFKEGILETTEEWTQHRKLIDTSSQGIRRCMVSHLPYFHVWFDPNHGLGHVIENEESWPSWFGKEILAGMMDIEPIKWRKPKRIEHHLKQKRLTQFKKEFDTFNWTKMLE